jgi:hypothetical protein
MCANRWHKERRKSMSWLEYRPRPVADISSFSIPLIAGKKIIEVPVVCGAGLRRFG